MLNQTKGGKRVYFSGLKVSRSQIISSPSGATGKLWLQESEISQFLQECKFPIMICQGQHCQSARHKHGDYLIMKAEWLSCSSGCDLAARGECGEPGDGTPGKGWSGSPQRQSRGQRQRQEVRGHPGTPSQLRPLPPAQTSPPSTGWKAAGNHCSSRAAHAKLAHSSPG